MEKTNREGWVSIHRQIRKHPLWTMERFTHGQAWIDLILRANHCNRDISYNGQIVTIERGWMLTSKVKLAEEWNWNVKTVDKYLKKLDKQKMICVKSDKTGTWIYIVNYNKYQFFEEAGVDNPEENHGNSHKENPKNNHKGTNNNGNTVKYNNKSVSVCKKNSFNDFKQNDYDFNAIENKLLGRK